MAAIITVPLMIHIYRHCEKPYMAVFGFLTLGLYFNSLNFIRQIIAAFIIMLGMRYIESGKFFRFLVLVVLASCFHVSAFMMLIFYFILKIRITPAVLAAYSAISILAFIFSYNILSVITTYVYRSYDPANSIHMTTGLFPIYTIYFGILFIAAFLLRESLTEKNSFNSILINCMFFAVFFEFIGIKHSIVSRPALYFLLPASIELVPQIFDVLLEKCREKFKADKAKLTISKAIVITSLTLLCTGMYEYMIVKGYNGVTPYQTVFDEEPEY